MKPSEKPLDPHFAARRHVGAPSRRLLQALDFAGFFAAGTACQPVPGLREIRAGGIMRALLTRTHPAGTSPAKTERACTRAAGKNITTRLITTMLRPFLLCSSQTRSGHVA